MDLDELVIGLTNASVPTFYMSGDALDTSSFKHCVTIRGPVSAGYTIGTWGF